MVTTDQSVVAQLLFPLITTAFFVLGVAGFVVGLGLIVSSPTMFRLFAVMNRWVSLRSPQETPGVSPGAGTSFGRRRFAFGSLISIGAVVSLYGLLLWVDTPALVAALRFDLPGPFVVWIVDSIRWFLVVGSAAALIVGLLMIVSPATLDRIVSAADRWRSAPDAGRGADRMNLSLDKWVTLHPRAAGAVIAIGALVVVASFGVLSLGS